MSALPATYRVVAHNYAFDSDNKIHSDDVASKFGFTGGLVPGVADFAYLARAVYDTWGEQWMVGGTMEAKFIKPIYHGDEARANAVAGSDDSSLTLELQNPEGVLCAAGTAQLDNAGEAPEFDQFPAAPAIDEAARPAPDPSTFGAGRLLAPYEYDFDARESAAAASEMFVDAWPSEAGWHPACALQDANRILRANVNLGPWIHTGSHIELFSSPADGEHISLRGRVNDTFEKRGHIMTECGLAMFSNERPIARIAHRAIIRLAGQ